MKKNKISLLSIAVLVCLPLVGCDSSNSQSISSSASSFNEDEQAFYNRVILDYYEQRIEQIDTLNMYLYNFEKSAVTRSINEICVYDLLESKESGAHILNVSAYSLPTFAGNVFFYAFDGKTFEYINETPPDVYYKGNFYYLTDAYFLGIIDKSDVISAFDIAFNDETLINRTYAYVNTIEPKEKTADQASFSDALLQSFRTELLSTVNNDDSLKDKNINEENMHVYQHFSESDGCYCVNFSIDNINQSRYLIEPINKKWEDSLILKDRTIEPFKDTYPVVWVNDAFYSIDEAITLNYISEATAVKLLDNYKISFSLDNGHLIAY